MTSTAILSTYPPTRCGLATFSASLRTALQACGDRVDVVSVVPRRLDRVPPEVVHQWVHDEPDGARRAAAVLDDRDLVVIQHEFGIFAGPDGADVLEAARALRTPSILVLHTVLGSPSNNQRAIVEELARTCDAVVTLAEVGRRRLLEAYDVRPDAVTVIPHGAQHVRTRATWPDGSVRRAGPEMLTWGLLGPGKGIEHALEALALLAARGIRVTYRVVGRTHPGVRAREGERYREGLRRRAAELGVADRLVLDDRYVGSEELGTMVAGTDVVLLPYEGVEQVTSGVLVEAVAAGAPVVATDFAHARELLGGGPGLLVPPRDAEAIAAAVARVLTEPGLALSLRSQAALLAPRFAWPAVARAYRTLGEQVRARDIRASA